MQIIKNDNFLEALKEILDYIAKDSVIRAEKFYIQLENKIKFLPFMPKMNRKSIYFNDKTIRDLIFKGYVLPYKITKNKIIILGIIKYKKGLKWEF